MAAMDDVDRLFECFKCGISPPQSAFKERKKSRHKAKQPNSIQKASKHSDIPSSGSTGKSRRNGRDTAKRTGLNSGNRISPLVFYGSPRGVPPKRPVCLARLLHEIRLDLTEQNKLRSREEVWVTFPRQDEAIKYAKEHRDVHVFSYQDHVKGQRRFLASTYIEFWRRYANMTPSFRHHYEVIQEGLPCHLYFDLEFNWKENAEKNGDEMVDLLLLVLFDALHDKYSIQGNYDWIVELDSSTKEKFSRHLIVRLSKTAFKDNTHVGSFVAEICSRIHSARETDKRFERLLICKDNSSPSQLFVDTAVYSRNRCFRLPLSSKAGKSSVLFPTGRFKCKDMSEADMFMASLICNMDVDCEKLLICKMDLDCVKALHFDTEINNNSCSFSGVPRELVSNSCTTDASRTYLIGKSPFPDLDMFVESVATIGSVSGKIQSWYWFSEYGLMVYTMSRNRYCERIGRQHKSNHVMYIVDLRRGDYYQKCHDPDCKGYRSPLRPVPEEVLPDSTVLFNSVGHNEFQEHNAKSVVDSCRKDEWWLEAIRVADNVEKKALTFMDETCDEDDEWWGAVEITALQTEEMYFGKI